MKRLFLALALTLTVAGCTTLETLKGTVAIATGQFNNPISRDTLYAFENTMIVAFAGLNAYRNACVRGTIASNCKQVVAKLQVYTRRIPPVLKSVRAYVDKGDQTNAIETYKVLQIMWIEFKSVAAANNVRIQ